MFWQKKQFLTKEETDTILQSIRVNEAKTSGEIRICIESNCPYMDSVERAKEIFVQLKMYNTKNRNAVLIYIAHKDKDFALFGDVNIFNKMERTFLANESKALARHFFTKNYVVGLSNCIEHLGAELNKHFPPQGEQKNELPDDIIFGK
jgi:uncharacterized membrane protein